MNISEANFTNNNYSLKLKKVYEQNSILIICENKNNKKSYFVNSECKLFQKPLDESFQLLYERIKDNNFSIKEINDEIIIEINVKNKNDIIILNLKQGNSNTTMSTDKNNYGIDSEIGVEHFDQPFSDSISSIPKNNESRLDISNPNLSIQIIIFPNDEILNNSYAIDYNFLFNLIQSKNYKGKKLNELTGLLKLCLLKKISIDLMKDKNIEYLLKEELMNILSKIDENIYLTGYSSSILETITKKKKYLIFYYIQII
jgi:hypothetical protein